MWTLQDAKNRFSTVVEAALGGKPQHVTRRGKPAVVVISEEDYTRLVQQKGEGAPDSFLEHLLNIPKHQVSEDEDEFLKALEEPRPRWPMRDIEF